MAETGPEAEREWADLATALGEMALDLLAQDSVQATLDCIVAHSVNLVSGCDFAGIMVVRGDDIQTVAVNDDLVGELDRLQAELQEGPCFDASRDKERVYRITDLTATSAHWPRFAPRAHDLGVGSMMGFLLYTRGDRDLGALDMYSSRPGAFTSRSEQVGLLLASHAAVALSSARHDANLDIALATRQAIGQATGIVMERGKLSERDAFAKIVELSQARNIKVRDLADSINRTGEFPGRRPR